MTSKRSFINIAKEDLKRRVWPIALALVGFFFALPVLALIKVEDHLSSLENGLDTLLSLQYSFASFALGPRNSLAVIGLIIMAVLNGMHGMKYLHNKQEMDFYGSVPMLRTEKFAAAYLNGILITAIPYVIMFLLAAVFGATNGLLTGAGFFYGVQTVLILLCSYVLIYSFVVLAAVLTGHGAVTLAASGVLTMGLLIYELLFEAYGTSFFMSKYDTFDIDKVAWLSPFTALAYMIDTPSSRKYIYYYMTGNYVAAVTGLIVAAALFILCMVLIKKRPAESAGKAMAFEITKPVVKVFIMVPVALAFGLMFPSISNSNVYRWLVFGIIVGTVIAHAVIEIIYEFDFKACTKHLPSMIAGGIITVLIVCVFIFDPFGYDIGLPKKENIVSAAVYADGINSGSYYVMDYRYDEDYMSEEERVMKKMMLKDIDDVYVLAQKGCEFAKANRMQRRSLGEDFLFAERDPEPVRLAVNMRLRSGKEVKRTFYLDTEDAEGYEAFKRIYDTDEYKNMEYFLLSDEMGPIEDRIQYISYGTGDYADSTAHMSREEIQQFLDTLKEETRALTLDTLKDEVPIGLIEANVMDDMPGFRDAYSVEIGYVYPSFAKTIALLEKHDIETGKNRTADDISYIKKTTWSDDYESSQDEKIEDKAEIAALLPKLVSTRFSGINYAVCKVSGETDYQIYNNDGSCGDYVLKE